MADAVFNRAREGLRVLEDLARFVLDDVDRVEGLKQARHALTEVAGRWPGPSMVCSRDTMGDVGTSVSTEAEGRRRDLQAVAAAAGRRVTEALRSLEELAKVEAPALAGTLEQLRYSIYDLAGHVETSLSAGRAPQWSVCLLLTEDSCQRPWTEVAAAAIDGGVDCIQLREKSLGTAELIRRARHLVDLAGPRNVSVIVNDRVDVALAARADGVHVGVDDMDPADVRSLAGNSLLLGVTVRTPADAETAIARGASYCGIGPMFASPTKPELVPAGPEHLVTMLPALGSVPHLAIGGIDLAGVQQVTRAGGRGVAVCHGICGATDPAEASRALVQAVQAGCLDATSEAVPGHA